MDFTYYDAKQLIKQAIEKRNIDIDELLYSETGVNIYTPENLAKTLDISISTANNWLSERTEISQLGKQAISFQLLLSAIECYKNKKVTNIISKNDNFYEIQNKDKNIYHTLAKTEDIVIARFLQMKDTILDTLNKYKEFLINEIEVRDEDTGLHQFISCKRDVSDLISYIQEGHTNSEIREQKKKQLYQQVQSINIPDNLVTTHNRNISEFISYCKTKYQYTPELSSLIIDILRKIKCDYSLLEKETKWISIGQNKNFLAIKLQQKNICIFIKDKKRCLKSDAFQIKSDRVPYVRFTIDSVKQKDEAIRIINASIENI